MKLRQEADITHHKGSAISVSLPPHINCFVLIWLGELWGGKDVIPNLRFEFICSHYYLYIPCSIKQAKG